MLSVGRWVHIKFTPLWWKELCLRPNFAPQRPKLSSISADWWSLGYEPEDPEETLASFLCLWWRSKIPAAKALFDSKELPSVLGKDSAVLPGREYFVYLWLQRSASIQASSSTSDARINAWEGFEALDFRIRCWKITCHFKTQRLIIIHKTLQKWTVKPRLPTLTCVTQLHVVPQKSL